MQDAEYHDTHPGSRHRRLATAFELRCRLGPDHRIVVVDREAEHRFQASFLWLMMGWREPADISRPLAGLAAHGIDFRQATIEQIDAANQRVETSTKTHGVDTSNESIDYDYLVIALGAQLAADQIRGLADAGLTPYSLDGATALRDAGRRLDAGSVAIVVADLPFKCPAAPYEAALMLEAGFRANAVRSKIQIDLYTPEPQPMPVAGPDLGAALTQVLDARGIGLHTQQHLTAVDAERRRLSFAGGPSSGEAKLRPPHLRAPAPQRRPRSPIPARQRRRLDPRRPRHPRHGGG